MEDVKLEIKEDENYGIIALNRPEKRNAMRLNTITELLEAFKALEDNPLVRCVILTASGDKAFTSGGDLNEELRYATSEPKTMDLFNRLGCEFILRIMGARFPVIAAVNGLVAGAGVCLVAACDLGLAVEGATFFTPTCALGGMAGWGSQVVIPRILGHHRAMRLLLANERLSAKEAQVAGLIEAIVKPDELDNQARALAKKIASYPPNSIALAKSLAFDCSFKGVADALAFEAKRFVEGNAHPNFAEGIKAFLEKRPPKFQY
ncbi:MAG: enoyl-CoA hydratase/isomerase family protein [Deltaproteobacteria bacterium]|jgi:enoyl-CoA hydratase/carnithine racemase|nr:enoyl-CoA hydratase/isomerase family protein [Deltaproteobacteria bacterium]